MGSHLMPLFWRSAKHQSCVRTDLQIFQQFVSAQTIVEFLGLLRWFVKRFGARVGNRLVNCISVYVDTIVDAGRQFPIPVNWQGWLIQGRNRWRNRSSRGRVGLKLVLPEFTEPFIADIVNRLLKILHNVILLCVVTWSMKTSMFHGTGNVIKWITLHLCYGNHSFHCETHHIVSTDLIYLLTGNFKILGCRLFHFILLLLLMEHQSTIGRLHDSEIVNSHKGVGLLSIFH